MPQWESFAARDPRGWRGTCSIITTLADSEENLYETSDWHANRTQGEIAHRCPNIPLHNAIEHDGLSLNSQGANKNPKGYNIEKLWKQEGQINRD